MNCLEFFVAVRSIAPGVDARYDGDHLVCLYDGKLFDATGLIEDTGRWLPVTEWGFDHFFNGSWPVSDRVLFKFLRYYTNERRTENAAEATLYAR